jgi:hypothetical protein
VTVFQSKTFRPFRARENAIFPRRNFHRTRKEFHNGFIVRTKNPYNGFVYEDIVFTFKDGKLLMQHRTTKKINAVLNTDALL